MNALLTPPNGNYLLEPHPTMLHQETMGWLSDLDFYKLELAFLAKLLDKAFLRVRNKQNISILVSAEKKIKSFRSKNLKELRDDIILHGQDLSSLEVDKFLKDENSIREEHRANGERMKEFINMIKNLKKEIFDLVEREIKLAKNK